MCQKHDIKVTSHNFLIQKLYLIKFKPLFSEDIVRDMGWERDTQTYIQ